MKTIILPGYPEDNIDWSMNVADKIKVEGEIWPVIWDKPNFTGEDFSPSQKVETILTLLGEDKVNIIAWAIGTYVSMLLLEKSQSPVGKIVLCGIPVNNLNDNDKDIYKKVLATIPVQNILVFQNNSDPRGSYFEVEKFLRTIDVSINIVNGPRNDNMYPYFGDFQTFLEKR